MYPRSERQSITKVKSCSALLRTLLVYIFFCLFVCFWRDSPQWTRAYSLSRFLDHTQRRITIGRTPLDKWSARLRDLYLHNTKQSLQTSMSPVGCEPIISEGERPQTYALDRAATATGGVYSSLSKFSSEILIYNFEYLSSGRFIFT